MDEQRVVIIGFSGSGKSTMAQQLGKKYSCKVLHLDCVHWMPGWRERDKDDRERIVSGFLDENQSWVIDGTYRSVCFKRRFDSATHIIILNFPMYICLFRVIRRYLMYRGKSRESMTAGCRERISAEFLWWILYRGRNKAQKDFFRQVGIDYFEKTIILKTPSEVKKFWERGDLSWKKQ